VNGNENDPGSDSEAGSDSNTDTTSDADSDTQTDQTTSDSGDADTDNATGTTNGNDSGNSTTDFTDAGAADGIAVSHTPGVDGDTFAGGSYDGFENPLLRAGQDVATEDNSNGDLPQTNEGQSKLAWLGALMGTFILGAWRLFRKRKD